MNSALDNEIERIRKAVNKQESIYTSGRGAEKNVLEHLVRPMLRALSWDDREIRTEVPVQSADGNIKSADFVLISNDEPKLVIEGKKLETNIGPNSTPVPQLREYLIGLDCRFGATTDGISWALWRRTGYRMENIWHINILEKPDSSAKTLTDLDRSNIDELEGTIELREVRKDTLTAAWQEILGTKDTQIDAVTALLRDYAESMDENLGIKEEHARKFLSEIYDGASKLFSFPAKAIEPEITQHETPSDEQTPRFLVINGERIKISDIYEILTKTVNWLHKNKHLKKEECPIKVTSGSRAFRYLVNTRPVHSNGQEFSRPKRVGDNLYVETHYNREGTIYYARKLLHKYIPTGELRTEN